MSIFRSSFIILWGLVSVVTVRAQDQPQVGSCSPGVAEYEFESRHVRAKLLNDGSLFWRRGIPVFHLPKEREVSPVFVANLLLSGFVNGDLRAAGTTYNPREFWPGPIPDTGSAPTDCAAYDRFWTADWTSDAPEEGLMVQPSANVQQWPHHLGAPIDDRDGIEGYDPDNGDLPRFMGDWMTWWIMNDAGGEHGRSRSAPLNVDVDVSAFAFDSDQPIGQALFLRYRITNRNASPIEDFLVGGYIDGELGHFADDRVGTDTTLSMLYFYNGDNTDEGGYGVGPPALGIALIEASIPGKEWISDPDLRARSLVTHTSIHHGGGGPQGDPQIAQDFRNQLQGRWRDGTPIYQGNIGYDPGFPVGRYWMPGDPVSGSFWSEVNIDGSGSEMWLADKKGYLSTGPFDLLPGETAAFTFVYALGQGSDHIDSITALRASMRTIHNAAPAILAPRGPKPPRFIDGNPPATPLHPFWVDEPYPNPASDHLNLRMSLKWSTPVTIEVVDALGRTRSRESFDGRPGPVTRRIQTDGLAPGTYLIRVSQRGERVDWPLIVL